MDVKESFFLTVKREDKTFFRANKALKIVHSFQ